MFFQSIYQMMSAGTDLNINIRRTDGKLSVAVMPRRTTLKDEAGQAIVPLILNGTPMELDGQFLQIITTPLQKAQGILTNLETFEQQARLTATQGKATGTANDKKTKEAREKQEKMEKLLKRAEEAFTAGKYSEATTCLRQAKVLADTDRQKQIEARIQEVQKESSQGCLFPETDTQPLPQQPPANGTANGNRPDGQMRMFTSQPPQQPVRLLTSIDYQQHISGLGNIWETFRACTAHSASMCQSINFYSLLLSFLFFRVDTNRFTCLLARSANFACKINE